MFALSHFIHALWMVYAKWEKHEAIVQSSLGICACDSFSIPVGENSCVKDDFMLFHKRIEGLML